MHEIISNQKKITKLFKAYKRNLKYLDYVRSLQNNNEFGVVVKEKNAYYVTKKEKQSKFNTFKEQDISRMKENLQSYIYSRDILYNQLNKDEKKLADYRFNDHYTVFQVMTKMFISESMYYRIVRRMNRKLINYYETFGVIFKYLS